MARNISEIVHVIVQIRIERKMAAFGRCQCQWTMSVHESFSWELFLGVEYPTTGIMNVKIIHGISFRDTLCACIAFNIIM